MNYRLLGGFQVIISSELLSTNTTVVTNSRGFTATAKNVTGIVASTLAGVTPHVGGAFTVVNTFYNVYKDVISGLTGQTSVYNVKGTYVTSLSAQNIYVFVKYSGDSDFGNQILAYCGNSIKYDLTVVTCDFIMSDEVITPTNNIKKYNGTISSPYYSSYVDKASENFYNYKNGSSIFTNYNVYSFYLNSVQDRIRILVPMPNSGF